MPSPSYPVKFTRASSHDKVATVSLHELVRHGGAPVAWLKLKKGAKFRLTVDGSAHVDFCVNRTGGHATAVAPIDLTWPGQRPVVSCPVIKKVNRLVLLPYANE